MEQTKPRFFKRLKDAIFNFDEYKVFAEEKLSVAVKYFSKLLIIFSLIMTATITIKLSQAVNKCKNYVQNEMPDFRIEDNILVIDGENKKYSDGYGLYLGLIVDADAQDIEEIEDANDYQRIIAFLKDKVVIKDENGMQNVMTYKSLYENNELSAKNKQDVLNLLTSNKLIVFYLVFTGFCLVFVYVVYSLQILFDVFLISIVGFLLSRIIGIKLQYSKVFSISIYSLSLSIILYIIYIIANLLFNFNIVYFDIAYRLIAYVYIITALFIIKSDLIKQKMELTKIVEVQKEVRKELEEKEKEEKQEDKKKEEKKEEKPKRSKKKEDKSEEEPQGNQA